MVPCILYAYTFLTTVHESYNFFISTYVSKILNKDKSKGMSAGPGTPEVAWELIEPGVQSYQSNKNMQSLIKRQ